MQHNSNTAVRLQQQRYRATVSFHHCKQISNNTRVTGHTIYTVKTPPPPLRPRTNEQTNEQTNEPSDETKTNAAAVVVVGVPSVKLTG